MERDFRYLRDKHGDAGAREIFEKICSHLLSTLYHSEAHGIRASQGDSGIDILIGDFNSPIENFQCKYFIDGINDSQKNQIRKSFKTAVESEKYTMKRWILCLPCTLSVNEFSWWCEWKNKTCEQHPSVEIELWDGDNLIAKLKQTELYHKVFDNEIIDRLDKILAKLPGETYRKETENLTKTCLDNYLTNSKEQLKIWKNKCGLLYNLLNDDEEYITMNLRDGQNEFGIDVFLANLQNNLCRHVILIGDGGMGKTTTCTQIWKTYLANNRQVFYISLCDYSKSHTIQNSIISSYGVDNYLQLITVSEVLFLLDGFNEMNNEFKKAFFEELRELTNKKNIQIIITSRNDVIDIETVQFSKLVFLPIEYNVVIDWLIQHNVNIDWLIPLISPNDNKEAPLSKELLDVLCNPMLLKIYSMSSQESLSLNNMQRATFLNNPRSTGEIIWNFLEHQIVKSIRLKEEYEGFSKIVYRHLLPFIAYQIEREGLYDFSMVNLMGYLKEFEYYFSGNFQSFNDLVCYKQSVEQFLADSNPTKKLLDLCVNNLSIIKLGNSSDNKGENYAFVHQYFRDIFSSTHIKNQMMLCDKSVFSERVFGAHIYKMLSEILQEHQSTKPLTLRKYLSYFKKEYTQEAQIGVFNALQIIDYVRHGDFSNEDFSELDLRMCSVVEKDSSNTDYSRAYIRRNMFFPQGHTHRLRSVCFSPNGNLILSTAFDNSIKIWDSKSGMLIRSLDTDATTDNARFSPDGKRIVSTQRNDFIKIWDSETGKIICKIDNKSYNTNAASFSPDGKYVLSPTGYVWESTSGKFIRKFSADLQDSHSEEPSREIDNATYSPDGKSIASTRENDIVIWNAENGNIIHIIEGEKIEINKKGVDCVNYSQDGKFIVSTHPSENMIKIWNSNTGKLVRSFTGHLGLYSFVYFSPDGKYILSISFGRPIIVFNSNTGDIVHVLNSNCFCENACFSPDGRYIAGALFDGSIRIWENLYGKLLRTFEGQMHSISNISCCPNGKHIVSVSTKEFSSDSAINIWDIEKCILVQTVGNKFSGVNDVSYNPNGKYILIAYGDALSDRRGSDEYGIIVWDKEKGEILHKLEGHTKVVNSAKYNLDGSKIISASNDNTIKIWDSNTGTLLTTLEGHTKGVECAIFSPNGNQIVSGDDKTIRLWNYECGDWVLTSTIDDEDGIKNISYSPDGKKFITTRWKSKIWDSESGALIHKLDYDGNGINSAIYSPDGNQILTAQSEGIVKVWDSSSYSIMFSFGKDWFGGNKEKKYHGVLSAKMAIYSPEEKHIIVAVGNSIGILKMNPKNILYLAIKNLPNLIIQIVKRRLGLKNNKHKNINNYLKTIHPLSSTKVLNADLRNIKRDDLTDDDLKILSQNGAIIK